MKYLNGKYANELTLDEMRSVIDDFFEKQMSKGILVEPMEVQIVNDFKPILEQRIEVFKKTRAKDLFIDDIAMIDKYEIEVGENFKYNKKMMEIRTLDFQTLFLMRGIDLSKLERYASSKTILYRVSHMPIKTIRLMQFILVGKKLLPPLGRWSDYNPQILNILDGTNRIAMSRYLGLEQIPVLVPKKYSKLIV